MYWHDFGGTYHSATIESSNMFKIDSLAIFVRLSQVYLPSITEDTYNALS
jgi:hypothetical protein